MNNKTLAVAGIILVFVALGTWSVVGSKKSISTNTTQPPVNTAPVVTYDASLTLSEFAFTPSQFKVHVNQTIRVQLTNKGKTTHSFTFKDLDFSSGSIAPGTSKVVVFTTPSKPGSYEFHCSLTDHKDKPMSGTMVVEK